MSQLQGDLVTLTPVTPADLPRLAAHFARPAGQAALHAKAPLPEEKLGTYLFTTKGLVLWELSVDGRARGFTGYRSNAGYPFFILDTQDGSFDAAVTQDCLLPLVHHYFQEGKKHVHPLSVNDPFMVYLPHAQADALEDFLLNNGFDPNTGHWWPDYSVLRAYELLPTTYAAYFQDES